jgi:hypothetical protein
MTPTDQWDIGPKKYSDVSTSNSIWSSTFAHFLALDAVIGFCF